MNAYTLKDVHVGTSESFQKEITLEMENAFRELTGDVNPLHYDDTFAREVSDGKYLSHVAFGMLTASFYSTLVGVYLPGKYSLIHSLDEIKFMKPVFAGDVLTITGEVAEVDEQLGLVIIKAQIRNQAGQCVSKAKIKVLILQKDMEDK